MSESTRGIIYRVLTILFVALVLFGVLTVEEAQDWIKTGIEIAAVLGFGLASKNTSISRSPSP